MPKNASYYPTIVPILQDSNVMLKIFQARLQCMRTKNFQMYKLTLEKAEEPEIQLLPSQKKQENSRKASTSSSLTMLKSLTVWITINWEILQELGIPAHHTCLLRNLYACQKAIVRSGHGTMDWFKIEDCKRLHTVTLII